MRISFLGTRHILTAVIALLIVLNSMLLWRDYQNKKKFVELQLQLQGVRVELRVSKAINLFGTAFVPLIKTVDLQGQDTTIPYFGTQDMLILFFKPWDCGNCLQNLSLFKSTIGENVPVVSIAQAFTVSEVKQSIKDYEYEFPIYVAKEMPFEKMRSVYCALITRNRSVLYLSEIEPNPNSVLETISEIEQIITSRS